MFLGQKIHYGGGQALAFCSSTLTRNDFVHKQGWKGTKLVLRSGSKRILMWLPLQKQSKREAS